ncbi:MAG: hypothetical protein C5B50_13580 [Verrucomicrobia bacterium]|nr:MAG: hypothetical protein C5B50_13580 [Verrucomicrobiota bacterium]
MARKQQIVSGLILGPLDGLGRLRLRAEYAGDGSTWVLQTTTGYIYDGWRVIQERDTNNTALVSYTRGQDLSGSLEGAGGIGGLLARSAGFVCTNTSLTVGIDNQSPSAQTYSIYSDYGTMVDGDSVDAYSSRYYTFDVVAGTLFEIAGPGDYYYLDYPWSRYFTAYLDTSLLGIFIVNDIDYWTSGNVLCGPDSGGSWTSHAYYHADGNGNVTCLIDESQSVVATYRYDPFGGILSQSGDLAGANNYRFSSKEQMPNSGLYYYGYRFYEPSLQSWINRDPAGEGSGVNLYTFVLNAPSDYLDTDGRSFFRLPPEIRWPSFPPIEIPWPSLPWRKPRPPASCPPQVNCAGYLPFTGSKCDGKPDSYPSSAYKCCQDFMEKYGSSTTVQCVANCLQAAEAQCEQESSCSKRADCRKKAHVDCYSKCHFVPVKGIPASCAALGLTGR